MGDDDSKVGATDVLLLEGLRQGDSASFEALFVRHYPRVRGLLERMLGDSGEAEELAQETFLSLYRSPLTAQREHNLSGWLFRVATHLGYNALRAQRRALARDTSWQSRAPRGDASPEEEAVRAEDQALVRRVLADLPERDARLLLLRHSGLSYQECADALGVAPASIGTLLARAERAFEQHYRVLEGREKGRHETP